MVKELITVGYLSAGVVAVCLTSDDVTAGNKKVVDVSQELSVEELAENLSVEMDINDFDSQNTEDMFDDLPLGAEAGEQGSSSINDDEDVVHNYFQEGNPSNSQKKKRISLISDATTTAPICRPLPSGKVWNDETKSTLSSSLFTDTSQKDSNSSPKSLPDGVNEFFLACRMGDTRVVDRMLERGDIDINTASTGEGGVTVGRLVGEGGDYQ
eukprot:gene621-110_t